MCCLLYEQTLPACYNILFNQALNEWTEQKEKNSDKNK